MVLTVGIVVMGAYETRMLIAETTVSNERHGYELANKTLKQAGWVQLGVPCEPTVDGAKTGLEFPRRVVRWGTDWPDVYSREVPLCMISVSFSPVDVSSTTSKALRLRVCAGDPSLFRAIYVDHRNLPKDQPIHATHFPTLIDIQVSGPVSENIPPPTSTELALRQRNPNEPDDRTNLRANYESNYDLTLPDRGMKFLHVRWSSHPAFQSSFAPCCVVLAHFAEVMDKSSSSSAFASTKNAILQTMKMDFSSSTTAEWDLRIDQAPVLLNHLLFSNPSPRSMSASKASISPELTLRLTPWPILHAAPLSPILTTAPNLTLMSMSNPTINTMVMGFQPVVQYPPYPAIGGGFPPKPILTSSSSDSRQVQIHPSPGSLKKRTKLCCEPGSSDSSPDLVKAPSWSNVTITPPPAPRQSVVSNQPNGIALDKLGLKELKQLLKDRGLKVSGNKQELLARLKQHH